MIVLPNSLKELHITGLTLDSRAVKPGYLFVAVEGVHAHGKMFIEQAAERGAVAVLVDKKESVNSSGSIPIIAIEFLQQTLSALAGTFYSNPSYDVPVIGITGTNGKTTCSQLLAQALAYLNRPCGVIGTLGYGLVKNDPDTINENSLGDLKSTGMTTPDAITTQAISAELLSAGAHCFSMEVSSHALSQSRVAAIHINTAIFTNLSHDHLDYHGDMDAYGAAKAALFAMPSVGTAIINQDDDYAKDLVAKLRSDIDIITYSIDQPNSMSGKAGAHFSLQSIAMGEQGMCAQLVLDAKPVMNIQTSLVGQFNLSNLLAIIAALYNQQYSFSDIEKVIPQLPPILGRMELIPSHLNFRVVVDYAHTPDALKNALQALVPHATGNLWCVFGCGGDRDRGKRPQMSSIAARYADKVIVTSDNPRTESPVQIFADIERGFESTESEFHQIIADRASAIEYVIQEAEIGDVILIAGKGHEDYQIIGARHFPFSDQQQARFNLRRREVEENLHD